MTTILSYLNLSIDSTKNFHKLSQHKNGQSQKEQSVLAVKSISPNPMGKLILPKGCSFYRANPLDVPESIELPLTEVP